MVLRLDHQATDLGRSEMWRPMTDRMNPDKAWVMGVLEPILLLLVIAAIAALLGLLYRTYPLSATSLDERLA